MVCCIRSEVCFLLNKYEAPKKARWYNSGLKKYLSYNVI